jgi:NAD(P)-dependent dehydrogenase (short-subunit alcohol dehydrogenase family)
MRLPFSLQNRNIIITGASSGLGRSIAIECSKHGASVFLIARNPERLKETYDQLEPGTHNIIATDLNEVSNFEDAITALLPSGEPIHGMVHAAGVEFTAPFSMTRPKHFEMLFSINVVAGFELARICSQKKFLDTRSGSSFIFISSIRAIHGQEGAVAYAASKGALLSGVRSLALEWAQRKIRVNTISPAIVKTPMTEKLFESMSEESIAQILKQYPLGFGEPLDVALSCIYLLSDASRWITGSNIVLDGGYSIR